MKSGERNIAHIGRVLQSAMRDHAREGRENVPWQAGDGTHPSRVALRDLRAYSMCSTWTQTQCLVVHFGAVVVLRSCSPWARHWRKSRVALQLAAPARRSAYSWKVHWTTTRRSARSQRDHVAEAQAEVVQQATAPRYPAPAPTQTCPSYSRRPCLRQSRSAVRDHLRPDRPWRGTRRPGC